MKNINFNLRGKADKHGKRTVYCVFTMEGKRYQTTTGIKTAPGGWNVASQRAGKNNPEKNIINAYLQQIENAVENYFITAAANHEKPTPENMIETIKAAAGRKTNSFMFWDFMEKIVEEAPTRTNAHGERITKHRVKFYENIFCLLRAFESQTGQKLSFAWFTEAGIKQVAEFMIMKNYAQNTIHKTIKTIKNILNNAAKQGANIPDGYKNYKAATAKTEHFALTEKELDQLEAAPMSAQRLENAKNVFLLGCYTGLRLSDLKAFKINTFTQQIELHQQKTGNKIELPVIDRVKKILEKYGGELPPMYSDATYNQLLKQVLKEAGINSTFEAKEVRGGQRIIKTWYKYERVTSHTARRTFATLLHTKGVSDIDIMYLGGWTDIDTVRKYILSDGEKAKQKYIDVWK